MAKTAETEAVTARCHCGAVSIRLSAAPVEVTECNCSLCRRYGVLWAYYTVDQIAFAPDPPATDSYAWNGRHVDFHRCTQCGCVTHWAPRKRGREGRAINARLLDPEMLAVARLRHKDGAGSGEYLD